MRCAKFIPDKNLQRLTAYQIVFILSVFIELSQKDSSCSANHGRFLKTSGEERNQYINLIHADENPSSSSTDNSGPQNQVSFMRRFSSKQMASPPKHKMYFSQRESTKLEPQNSHKVKKYLSQRCICKKIHQNPS